jgi:NAD(P)-dependent dehydrogenase (short-subunit alcohol dehydrogenase family)
MPFHFKTVVVTGGTGALGAAIVDLIVSRGGRCIIPSRKPSAALPVGGNGTVEIVTGINLEDEAAVARFYESLPLIWASIHVAGGYAGGPLESQTKADFYRMMETNAASALLCCREAVKKMRAAGAGGRIVNVASRSALVPMANMTSYAMSKAAVAALTQCLAEEVIPDGILVNAVAPAVMDTLANRAAFGPGKDFSKWPSVADVAQTVVYLAGPDNRCIRGAVVPVYGKT